MKITRYRKIQWFTPLILYIALILDSATPAVFPNAFLGNGQTIVSHIVLYYIVTLSFYFRESNVLICAGIFGLLTDAYTGTILGIYFTAYLMATSIVLRVKRYFPKVAAIHWLLFALAIVFVDLGIYLFYYQIGYTSEQMVQFMANHLVPTLIYNAVLSLVLHFPTKSLLRWLGYDPYLVV